MGNAKSRQSQVLRLRLHVLKDNVSELTGTDDSGKDCLESLQEQSGAVIKAPGDDEQPHEPTNTLMFRCRGTCSEVFKAAEIVEKKFPDLQVSLLVFVPQRFMGPLIGKEGETIKKLQEDTSTRVSTPRRRQQGQRGPRGPQRTPVTISGTPKNVERCYELVWEEFASVVEQREKARAEAMAVQDESGEDAYRGRGRGFRGRGRGRGGGFRGGFRGRGRGGYQPGGYEQGPDMPAAGTRGRGGARGGAVIRPRREPIDTSNWEVELLPYPENMTGLLFGKQYQTITRLRRQSRCHLQILVEKHEVEIKGRTHADIDKAKELINSLLTRVAERGSAPAPADAETPANA
eukprot:Rmarinus@m.21227